MVKPRNWKEINRIREIYWKEIFDDINNAFDELSENLNKQIDAKRRQVQTILLEKSHPYKSKKV